MPRSKSVESSRSKKDTSVTMETIDPFLMTFEKPTQIYRYLRTRSVLSPLYLQRNLSYMKGRCSRTNRKHIPMSDKEAKKAALGEIIDKMRKKREAESNLLTKISGNENLIIGFIKFHDDALKSVHNVTVTTKLAKVSKKGLVKEEVHIGSLMVSVNHTSNNTDSIPAVCITKNEFNKIAADSTGSGYQLIFDILDHSSASRSGAKDSHNGPPAKQPCLSRSYTAKQLIFDKAGISLVIDGIHEIVATEKPLSNFGNLGAVKGERVQMWLAAQDPKEHKVHYENETTNWFDEYEKKPKIHMCLTWSREPLPSGTKDIKKPKTICDQQNNNKENMPLSKKVEKMTNGHKRGGAVVKSEENKPFWIQFVANATTKQRTEERYDYTCPWCVLKCPQLFGLIYHLRLCHSRLSFQLVDEGTKYRIDVFLNEAGSTSYEGAPHRLLIGTKAGPTKKSPMNQILVAGRRRRLTFNLSDFNDNEDFDQQHHYISGHNRIYYHTDTCIPIMPKELDYDSEGEPDPEWLQKTTKQMIDEFTDVNDGEKELMKLWNLHNMKHLFVGDCHVYRACTMFIEEKGEEVLKKNLKRNYLTHLQSMSDFGLLSPSFILENYRKLLELEEKIMDAKIVQAQRTEIVKAWQNSQSIKEVIKSKQPASTNVTPSKRRNENRLSKSNSTTPKATLDEKNKQKSR